MIFANIIIQAKARVWFRVNKHIRLHAYCTYTYARVSAAVFRNERVVIHSKKGRNICTYACIPSRNAVSTSYIGQSITREECNFLIYIDIVRHFFQFRISRESDAPALCNNDTYTDRIFQEKLP